MGECQLCMDPDSNRLIEKIFRREMSYRDVAEQYDMNAGAVWTHVNNHQKIALRPAMRRVMLNPDVTQGLMDAKAEAAFVLVDKLASLSDSFDQLMRQELDNSTQRVMNDTARVLKDYLHELAVWVGDVEDSHITVNITQNYFQFKQIVLEVLQDHPDALSDLEERLVDLEDVSGWE